MDPDGRHRRLITGSDLSRSFVFEAVQNQISETKVEHFPRSLANLGLFLVWVKTGFPEDVSPLVVDTWLRIRHAQERIDSSRLLAETDLRAEQRLLRLWRTHGTSWRLGKSQTLFWLCSAIILDPLYWLSLEPITLLLILLMVNKFTLIAEYTSRSKLSGKLVPSFSSARFSTNSSTVMRLCWRASLWRSKYQSITKSFFNFHYYLINSIYMYYTGIEKHDGTCQSMYRIMRLKRVKLWKF